ncbi:CBS domain-containing protein [Haliangium sp.]|uniref:CBS domain-containing protein n=1 Tax=Haliangium sp. TaxID=2663208 RepID=UPI003D0CB1CB
MSTKRAPRVAQYMTRLPHTIDHRQPLAQAHELMRTYQIRHLPVLQDGKLLGLVSLRDLHLIETLRDVDPNDVPVEDAMADNPYTVSPDEPLDAVAAVMANNKIGSAVVVDQGEVQGIFTTVDALRALLHLWKEQP